MSEASFAPPPPPQPSKPAFDFVKPFAFVFQDRKWVQKILIGGLFYIASFLIIGVFFILGYCARLARNVIEGQENPLPEWDDLGEYLSEGLKLFAVVLVYVIPFIFLVAAMVVPAIFLSATSHSRALEDIGGGMMTCLWCLMFPLGLALSFWLPGALLMCIVERSFSAAFDFARIGRFIRDNVGNYLLAYIIYLVARFAVPLGLLLLCIGVVFTAFWAMLTATCAFAQAYRLGGGAPAARPQV